MLEALAVSLVLTLALEELFALAWGVRGRRELLLVALVNCLTNPPVVLLHAALTGPWPQYRLLTTAALEVAAVFTEWRCYRAFSRQLRRPLLFALAVNAFSYGAGWVAQHVLFLVTFS